MYENKNEQDGVQMLVRIKDKDDEEICSKASLTTVL